MPNSRRADNASQGIDSRRLIAGCQHLADRDIQSSFNHRCWETGPSFASLFPPQVCDLTLPGDQATIVRQGCTPQDKGRSVRFLVSLVGLLNIGLLLGAPAVAREFQFQPIGVLPGGIDSSVFGVSADGSSVVGASRAAAGDRAFRWTSKTGMVAIGDLPGGLQESDAFAVSANGSVIVGYGSGVNGREAFRWTAVQGMTSLGSLSATTTYGTAYGVSADGSAVVGFCSSDSGFEAFRWTTSGGMQGLGGLSDDNYNSFAFGISPDGAVVVGVDHSADGYQAFRWDSTSGMVGLGGLLPGSDSFAYSTSSDGAVIVGDSFSSGGKEAFRWRSDSGMVGLGDLPGGIFQSNAAGVSADGSLVVGSSSVDAGTAAFVWTSTMGMINLRDFLVANGVSNLANWQLREANAISADGRTIAGAGVDPNGATRGWVATLPILGDATFDDVVDGADYTVWANHYLSTYAKFAQGDFNFDGIVNGVDYTIWADHFVPHTGVPHLAAVPEPSSLLLAAIGIAASILKWKRQRGLP